MNDLDIAGEVRRVLEVEGKALLHRAEQVQEEAERANLKKALTLIQTSAQKGGKIVVTGVGKSGLVGRKIAATLASTGSLSVFLHPTEGIHGDLGMVSHNDVVLAISYTGNTEELARLLPHLQKLKIPILAMTGNAHSKLGEAADAVLNTAVIEEACPHRLAPTTSTTLALAMGDAIATSLMRLRGFNPENFARNHPGGSIGNRLNLKVEDLMHSKEKVGIVSEQSTMEEVIIVATDKKLGGVLVTQGKTLKGIITDGDLRRALKHREKFFQLSASQVMTASPVTVSPETKALDALRLMEKRSSQISCLPVINDLKEWVGLLRLHDIAQRL